MEEATKIIIEQAWTWGDTVNCISTGIMAICTIVIAGYARMSWKVSKGIEMYTSMVETHSDKMLKIEAMRGVNDKPIPTYWWDPTIAAPPIEEKHGEKINLDKIHFYVRKELRENKEKVPITKEALK